jgi:hypothetical protein
MANSFSGEVSDFFLLQTALTERDVFKLAGCRADSRVNDTSEAFRWTEGTWGPLTMKMNGTALEAIPVGMHVDRREVCTNASREDAEGVDMLPLYRKQPKEYHEKVRMRDVKKP